MLGILLFRELSVRRLIMLIKGYMNLIGNAIHANLLPSFDVFFHDY